MPITTTVFRQEAQRRLIDTFGVAQLLGLRTNDAVLARLHAGKLPEPVLSIDKTVTLWDRDEIESSQK
jgi:2-methylcitrate dehydratase PrpD